MLPFEGRTVVVTGGSGALGAAVVQLLAQQGARCFIPARHESRPPKTTGPGSAVVVPNVDLSDEASVERFYFALPACWASIHAAGAFGMSPIASTSKSDFQRMFDTNAVTAFLCSREAVKKMRASANPTPGGRIVNVAAKVALYPAGGMIPYSVSKAGVVALTQSLAEELAPEKIWVNAVLPSIMDTPANRKAFPPDTDYTQWPKVEEVAGTIAFLASPENRITRGALVPV